jgi:hypothetical protein
VGAANNSRASPAQRSRSIIPPVFFVVVSRGGILRLRSRPVKPKSGYWNDWSKWSKYFIGMAM